MIATYAGAKGGQTRPAALARDGGRRDLPALGDARPLADLRRVDLLRRLRRARRSLQPVRGQPRGASDRDLQGRVRALRTRLGRAASGDDRARAHQRRALLRARAAAGRRLDRAAADDPRPPARRRPRRRRGDARAGDPDRGRLRARGAGGARAGARRARLPAARRRAGLEQRRAAVRGGRRGLHRLGRGAAVARQGLGFSGPAGALRRLAALGVQRRPARTARRPPERDHAHQHRHASELGRRFARRRGGQRHRPVSDPGRPGAELRRRLRTAARRGARRPRLPAASARAEARPQHLGVRRYAARLLDPDRARRLRPCARTAALPVRGLDLPAPAARRAGARDCGFRAGQRSPRPSCSRSRWRRA